MGSAYFCDRCGKTVPNPRQLTKLARIVCPEGTAVERLLPFAEVCEECRAAVVTFARTKPPSSTMSA